MSTEQCYWYCAGGRGCKLHAGTIRYRSRCESEACLVGGTTGRLRYSQRWHASRGYCGGIESWWQIVHYVLYYSEHIAATATAVRMAQLATARWDQTGTSEFINVYLENTMKRRRNHSSWLACAYIALCAPMDGQQQQHQQGRR